MHTENNVSEVECNNAKAEVPEWWSELISRCEQACEQSLDPEKFEEISNGRFEGYNPTENRRLTLEHWRYLYAQPPVDLSIAGWLSQTASNLSLLKCHLHQEWLEHADKPHREYVMGGLTSSDIICEVRRVILSALLAGSPKGLSTFIPSNTGEGLFGPAYSGSELRTEWFMLLHAWAGMEPANSPGNFPRKWTDGNHAKPGELWDEIGGLGLLIDDTSCRMLGGQMDLLVLHAWCAWSAGKFNATIQSSLFSRWRVEHFIQFINGRELHLCPLDEFHRFEESLPGLIRDEFARRLDSEDDLAPFVDFTCRDRELATKAFLYGLKKVEQGQSISDYAHILKLSSEKYAFDSDSLQNELANFSQPLLKKVVPYTGYACSVVLESISDEKFRKLMQATLGAFSEPIAASISTYSDRTYPEFSAYYPGRTNCGVTNFDELVTQAKLSTKKLQSEVVQIVKDSPVLSDRMNLLKLILGDDLKKAGHTFAEDTPEVLAFARGLSGQGETETEIKSRVRSLAKYAYENRNAGPGSEEVILHAVKLACLYTAASMGFNHMIDASIWFSRLLINREATDFEGIKIYQTSNTQDGTTIQKGNRELKNLPPALKKSAEANEVLAQNFLLHQLYRLSFKEVTEARLKLRNASSMEYLDQLDELFGGNFTTSVENYLSQENLGHLSNYVEESIKELVTSYRVDCHESSLLQFNVDPGTLKEHGWHVMFHGKSGTSIITRDFEEQGISFDFDYSAEKKGSTSVIGLKAVNLSLKRTCNHSKEAILAASKAVSCEIQLAKV